MIIIKSLLKSIKSFMDDKPMIYAAALAFYTLASIPAILLIAINFLSRAYENDEIQESLLSKLNFYLGPGTMDQAEVILENVSLSYNGIIPQIIGFGLLLFSATTVFISLQSGINKIWGVKADQNSGIVKMLMDRLISFATIIIIGFILLVSLVIDSLISVFQNLIVNTLSLEYEFIIWIINISVSLLITSSIFAMIFKFLPDVKTKWSNMFVGGLFTAILFLIGKLIIGYYISTTDVGSAYGASGSLVVFLSWVYYSSILVLFGAKFTYEYTLAKEDVLVADPYSTFVREKTIEEHAIKTETLDNQG